MACIFCGSTHDLNSVEHIVPESLGNKSYTLDKGKICKTCNNKFSAFEGLAQTNSILGYERARLGIKTKKGKPAKGETGRIGFIGSENFEKNLIRASGLKDEDLKDIDPETNTFKIRIENFSAKSASDMSKLLLKMGFESLSKSNKPLLNKYNFDQLKEYVLGETNDEWPFAFVGNGNNGFQSVPTYTDKYLLSKIPCKLLIKEIDENNLIFRFEYGGGIVMEINLLNRDDNWITDHSDLNNLHSVYPTSLNAKFGLETK